MIYFRNSSTVGRVASMDGAIFEANPGVSSGLILSSEELMFLRETEKETVIMSSMNIKSTMPVFREAIPAAAESENAAETTESSSFNSNSEKLMLSRSPMSETISYRDDIPDNLETAGQIAISIPAAADSQNAAETAESSSFNSNSEELMLSRSPMSETISYRDDIPDNLETTGQIAISIPAAADSQNAAETAESSSFNSNIEELMLSRSPMSETISYRDDIPDNLETAGQIAISIPAAANSQNAAETADSSSFNSNSEVLRNTWKAVKSFLFLLLCLIIPYHERHLLGNAGNVTAADERIKQLSTALMAFCTAWAVGQFFVSEEIRSKSPVFYNLLSITVALAFCSVLVGNLIHDRSPVTAHATLVTGILLAIIAFGMTLTIPLSLPIQLLIWLIFAFMFFLVVRCRSSLSGRRPGNDAVISLGDEQVDTSSDVSLRL